LECLAIGLACCVAAMWMAVVSYVDYKVVELLRISSEALSGQYYSRRLLFQPLQFPWGSGQWIISGVIVLMVALVLGIINFWALLFPAIIVAFGLVWALYNDAQQIEQIYQSLPPPSLPSVKPIPMPAPGPIVFSAKLIGTRGEHTDRVFEFDQKITIGRSRTNDIQLSEDSVSRLHAQIVYANRRWFIQDQKSGVGTYVNDQKIQGAQRIHQRDRIRIGSSEFKFTHS